MIYFTNCKTAEELKKEYLELCKQLHPDNAGNAEDFKKMQDEFSKPFFFADASFLLDNQKGLLYNGIY